MKLTVTYENHSGFKKVSLVRMAFPSSSNMKG
ncbi:hypothetical protein SAMN05216170_1479 [Thermococcus thioreducens]|uniref:Uncharacterized protein n=1 Tax=Thermococcus thioreducens TaxID=277988 RepID=A0A1I0P353_9EURY|nr:hypothetical protein SAMN05216170_1479 [Thermococcus thioreducens]